MAISFGRGLLALATGGAEVINEEAEAHRKSAARAQELAQERATRMLESRYAAELKTHASKAIKASALRTYNAEKNPGGLINYLTKERGMTDSQIKSMSQKHRLDLYMQDLKENTPGDMPSWDPSSIPDIAKESNIPLGDEAPAMRKIMKNWGSSERRLQEAAKRKIPALQQEAATSVSVPSEEDLPDFAKQELQASRDMDAEVRRMLAPEDTFTSEAKDPVVRLTAQLESVEQQLAQDPDNASLIRRQQVLSKELENEIELTGRTEADLQIKFRLQRELEQINNTVASADQALQSLDRYAELAAAATSGVPGAVQSFQASISNTIRGIAELTGFTQLKSIEQQTQELAEAGLTGDDINKMDSQFLQGMTSAERVRLIYSLASTFKEEGRRNVNNLDIENATKLVGTGAGFIDSGRIEDLREGLLRKQIAAYERGYAQDGISAKEKAKYAVGYFRTAQKRFPDAFKNADGTPKVRNKDWKVDSQGTLWFKVGDVERKALGLPEDVDAISLEEFLAATGGGI